MTSTTLSRVKASLETIKNLPPALGQVFTAVRQQPALEAEAQDANRSSGPLQGAIIAVKDNIVTGSDLALPTTASSRILEGYQSHWNADVVQKTLDAGGIVIGKTACDEFGMGSAGRDSATGPVRNPVDHTRVAGGSSSGSAVAVASGCADMALGTDTGGSVRLPAAWTGTVGFKPSYGLPSRRGLIAYASSLDTPGVITKSVHDAGLLGSIICSPSPDAGDSSAARAPSTFRPGASGWDASPLESLKGLRVGIPAEYWVPSLDSDVSEAWKEAAGALAEAGAEIVPVSLPSTKHALPTYYIISCAEASSNLARYDGVRYGRPASDWEQSSSSSVLGALLQEDAGLAAALDLNQAGTSPSPSHDTSATTTTTTKYSTVDELYAATRSEGFGREVQRRILAGTFVLTRGSYTEFYEKAQIVRGVIRRELDALLASETPSSVDVLLTPSAPFPAPTVDEWDTLVKDSPQAAYSVDALTVPASLAGLPAISVPWNRTSSGLPIGLQIIAGRYQEQQLLSTAASLEALRR